MTLWLAHDDDNKVVALYSAEHDTVKKEIREVTDYLRRGLTVRQIKDPKRASKVWASVVTESVMGEIAHPPDYSPADGAAARIAESIVGKYRGGAA